MHPRDDYPPPGSLLSRWLSDDEQSTLHRATPPMAGVDQPMSTSSSTRSNTSPSMVSPEEYASLPPSIQRKYFSSVERLRIAQESAVQSRKKAAAIEDPCLSHRPSADVLTPRRPHAVRTSSLRASPSKNTLAARWSRSDVDVDEHQALRFLALPSKVKRSHFTQEELALLTESSERVLGWAALHVNPDRQGSVGSSHYFSSDSGNCIHDMEQDWFEAKTESLHSLEHADVDERLTMLHTHSREASLGSTVDSAQPRPITLAIQRPASRYNNNNKSTKRRRSIFAPLPLPPPTLLPAVPLLPSPTLQKPTESGPETKYYKDTDARSKLRDFLTSPEKFDEALEFGFPERRATSPIPSVEPSLQSELDDLSVSHTRDDDDDDDLDDYMSGPRTPSVLTDGYNPGILHHNSLDSGVALPLKFARGKGSIRSLSPDFEAGRSMTLKMTLTRSDLRAPEDKLYSMARMQASGVDIAEADPLALDPLHVCDDHTGAQGAFAIAARTTSSGGGFKKVWKGLRGL